MVQRFIHSFQVVRHSGLDVTVDASDRDEPAGSSCRRKLIESFSIVYGLKHDGLDPSRQGIEAVVWSRRLNIRRRPRGLFRVEVASR